MYAGFWNRFAATFIDGLVIIVVEILLLTVLPTTGAMAVVLPILILVLIWLYEALMVSSAHQGTLGKIAVGIKVTDLAGERIGFGRATARFFGKLIGYFAGTIVILLGAWLIGGIGAVLFGLIGTVVILGSFLIAAFTVKRQALHDIVASCLVVQKDTVAGTEPVGVMKGVGWAIILSVALTMIPVFGAIFASLFLGLGALSMLGGLGGGSLGGGDAAMDGPDPAMVAKLSLYSAVGPKMVVEQYAQTHEGNLPASLEQISEAGLPAEFVDSDATITIENGEVVLTFTQPEPIAGRSLAITPSTGDGGLMEWQCRNRDLPEEFVPSECDP
jgi:uncharacterized RDD family membrane protein YckC